MDLRYTKTGNTIRIVEIVQLQVSIDSHLNRLSPIICTWFESPKVVLYAGSYWKLKACTVVELWQHKISNISRMVENCPTSRLHSFKNKGVVTPTYGWLKIPKPSDFIWCMLHAYSTLHLGATRAQTHTLRKRLQNMPCLTYPCFQPGSHVITKCSESFQPKHLIWAVLFHSVPRLEQQSTSNIQSRNHGHLAISGLTAPLHVFA